MNPVEEGLPAGHASGTSPRRRIRPLPGMMLGVSLVLLGGLLLPGLTLGAPPPAATLPVLAAIPAAAGPCVAGWREMPIPDSAFISTGFEVANRGGKPAWIMGGTNKGLLALKWNGSAWRRTATGLTGHRGIVGGVATSYRTALGAGYYRPVLGEDRGSLRPVAGKLVGTSWRSLRIPDPPGPRASLTDVVALRKGRAWVVGSRLQAGRLKAYAARWNGSSWRRLEPWSGTGAGLMAADRTPKGKVWAAGWREVSKGRPRPYVVRRTSRGWKGSRGAPVPAGNAAFTDITFPGNAAGWAVGYVNPVGVSRFDPFLQKWDGSGWSNVPLPWAQDESAIPRSVAVAGPGELYIAGTQLATSAREARGFIAHLKDGTWEVSVLGVPRDVTSEVFDVDTTSWGAVASASVGASLLVLRTCVPDVAIASGGSRRVAVSDMAARRAVTRAEQRDLYGSDGGGGSLTASAVALGTASSNVKLAAPVAPKNFVVRDMAAASGLAQTTRTYDGLAADFDGNGWRDVFYSRHGGVRPRLALNGPGGFTDAPGSAFTTSDRHGCDRGDVDNDGNMDIFCAIGASRGKALMRHELSLAVATSDRRFARGALGIADPMGRGRFVAFLRLDDDQYPELFILNAAERDDGLPGYNRFFRNVGGRFLPAPGVGLDTTEGGSCVLTGDFDGDHDHDLVYCVDYPTGGRTPGIRFMRNEGGRLKNRTGRLGIRPMGDVDVAFGDVNGDGHEDLFQLSRSHLRVSKWTAAGYRQIYQTWIGKAWRLDVGDVNGDGRVDVYIVRGTDKKNLADRLLVSRRGGYAFTSVKIPQTSQGTGDDVFALDYDRNGLTDFVVLNGRKKAGPVQLLASFKR